jgi:hypothetical protein
MRRAVAGFASPRFAEATGRAVGVRDALDALATVADFARHGAVGAARPAFRRRVAAHALAGLARPASAAVHVRRACPAGTVRAALGAGHGALRIRTISLDTGAARTMREGRVRIGAERGGPCARRRARSARQIGAQRREQVPRAVTHALSAHTRLVIEELERTEKRGVLDLGAHQGARRIGAFFFPDAREIREAPLTPESPKAPPGRSPNAQGASR